MSAQVSGAPSQNAKSEVVRRTENFHPSIWGDRFINNTSKDKDIHLHKVSEVEELKDERLGVAYHFEREIQEALEHLYATFNDKNDVDDLCEVSLSFRLLRQEGFKVSCVQSLHKEELSDITRWWKDLDFATKLPFARDRVVECYFWIVAVYFEPRYSLARKILTKVISMTSILDDIYDVYGTLEELEPFTEAIERWDISCIDQLPECMQICYRALFDVFEAIENELAKKERSYRVSYGKDAMKRLVRAYFDEAKWFHQNYIPTMEEYMHVALKTSGYPMLTAISFLGMGDIVTKEAFDWIFNNPKIITASSVIGRLMDDMKSHKFEQERGHAASAVECYMKQHGVSEQVVHDEFNRQVANAWKDINEECIRPTVVPMPLLMRVLNLARVIDVIYKEGDGYTHVGKEMKDNVASVLIDPIPL
ncbi:hypothetical protein CMV_024945 [Castanea mollissima]|uniref:Sesquiterpene synthase n=1 Tax=Castanea mollissima TaxID=60419 RepID=A0A8J4QQN9_9ROSI|nr:hypothetical protein CMV_024945 [Castanea mollissima]